MRHTQRRAQRGAMTRNAMEVVTAIVIFALGVVMMVDNFKIGAGWASDGPESGYFPFRIGAILCIASFVVALRAFKSAQGRSEVFVSGEKFKLVLAVLIPTTIYVLGIQLAGIYIASTVFIAGFMRVMDKSSWAKTFAVSVGVNAVLFWMFEIQFKVPLPQGPLRALFGT
ncbi:MAG: tripartite tricarboxylate transporter TctB family protein [Rhodoferax sp.]